jgi:hypothetical protein
MRESHIRKIQKNRHMSDIMMMINNNSIFKNLTIRDKNKLAKLIYKAELIETHIRDKDVIRVSKSFQEIIANAMMQIDLSDDDDDLDDDFDDLPPGFGPKD